MLALEVKEHLVNKIIPFWKKLRDDENGGYYGWLGYDLKLDKKAEKGCILNSRIAWFFSNAYLLIKDKSLLEEAKHAYEFLRDKCIDKEYGGVFWSLNYDGSPADTTKHSYNQAFCIYALSSYYEASKDENALLLAKELFNLIEDKCTDDIGYLEAFTRDFKPESNEKLSENGVIAEKTMNTLLHVLEAYTQLYKVDRDEQVKERLLWIINIIENKIYNPNLHRQEVFFDKYYNSIIDLHSYGHDIETAWLLDLTLDVIGDEQITERVSSITRDLTNQTFKVAFNGDSLANECENGVVNDHRVWWVQAENVVGLINAYQRQGEQKYFDAAVSQWEFIKKYLIDSRENSEWFWDVTPEGKPYPERPIVGPWKCPYHNGRMCFEVMRRLGRN